MEENKQILPNENKKDEGKNLNKKEGSEIKTFDKSSEECNICMFFLMIMIFIFFKYFIKIFAKISSIYFLVNIAILDASKTKRKFFEYPYSIVGFLILCIYPLINFITPGYEIISIQNTNFQKFSCVILILFESLLEIPLTFFYENNMYSIYLFQEEGVEKLLAPWLIFYPTRHILSAISLLRNILECFYFIGLGTYAYLYLSINEYAATETTVTSIMLTLNVLKAGFTIFLVLTSMIKACEEKKMKDDEEFKKKTKQDQDKLNKTK